MGEPQQLFNTDSKEIDPYWIDPSEPLRVPVEPLHVKAHKLQLLLDRLDKQASKAPAQFNSSNYLAILNEYTKCCTMINEGKTGHDLLVDGSLDENGKSGRQAPMGDPVAPGLGSGVSPDNPLAG